MSFDIDKLKRLKAAKDKIKEEKADTDAQKFANYLIDIFEQTIDSIESEVFQSVKSSINDDINEAKFSYVLSAEQSKEEKNKSYITFRFADDRNVSSIISHVTYADKYTFEDVQKILDIVTEHITNFFINLQLPPPKVITEDLNMVSYYLYAYKVSFIINIDKL